MKPSEHELLIAALLEDELDAAGHERLQVLMKEDPKVRQLYLDHCQMLASLKWEEGSLNAEISPTSTEKVPTVNESHSWFKFAAAALFLMGLTYLFLQDTPSQKPKRGDLVANVIAASGIEFEYGIDGTPVTQGQDLPSGEYHLTSGLLELEYNHKTRVVIEAPANFHLSSPQKIQLVHGTLTAKVPSSIKAFRVETPDAYIDDIGTEYGLSVEANSNDEVHVFTGSIVLHSKQEDHETYSIKEGHASMVNSPSSIDLNTERYVRRLEEPDYSYSELILKNDPVLYFPMQPSVDGITLMDTSKSQQHGLIHGVKGRPLWTVGRIGTCIRFEGPTKRGYVRVHDYPKTTNNTLSGAAWVYAKSRPKWASIMKNWGPGPAHGQFHFGLLEYEGCLEIHIEDANGEEVFALDSKPLPLHQWHHVAFVADGALLRLYRNGEEVAQTPYTSIHSNPDIKALAIGTKLNKKQTTSENNYHNDWHGRLDELSLFNHALSSDLIKQLYLAGLSNLELN